MDKHSESYSFLERVFIGFGVALAILGFVAAGTIVLEAVNNV